MHSLSRLVAFSVAIALFAPVAEALTLRGPVPAPTPRAHAAGRVLSAERLIRQCANRHRRDAGLPMLVPDPVLDHVARLHARRMRWKHFFDHTDDRGWTLQDRVDAFTDAWAVGENIAHGYRSVRDACVGWMNSTGHRANILNGDYEAIGVGYAEGPRRTTCRCSESRR